MANLTRTFTVDELEEMGVPFECGAAPDLATELHCEQVDTRRWSSVHAFVFRAPDDGKAYQVHYQSPLTERQECGLWFDASWVTATLVEARQVTVTKWLPVETAA